MLIAADPERADAEQLGLPDLPYARKELQFAKGPNDETLDGPRATRQRFLQRAPHHGILHIAGHGIFERQHPIDSRVLLAPDRRQGDLTATELFKVAPQWKAHLIVLSACQTSLSAESHGMELIGLQRGLLFAGAGSIVGSLWQIQDQGTYRFMSEFYRQMEAGGQSIAGALAQAQRTMIARSEQPGVWAAFTYTGIHE